MPMLFAENNTSETSALMTQYDGNFGYLKHVKPWEIWTKDWIKEEKTVFGL